MSKVSLGGSATGTATFDIVAPATNTSRTITLPDSSGQVSVLDLRTAVTASGTAVDFLNIPATARRITVMFSGVSLSAVSHYRIQLGTSSGVQTTGYLSGSENNGGTALNSTAGFDIPSGGAAQVLSGAMTLTALSSATWVASSAMGFSNFTSAVRHGGAVTLSGPLDRLRITTVNGTDTFDAGTINIMVE